MERNAAWSDAGQMFTLRSEGMAGPLAVFGPVRHCFHSLGL